MRNIKLVFKTVLLILFALSLGTCASFPDFMTDPSVSFDSVSFTGINFEGVDLLVKVLIQNNNSFAIPFPEIDWNFIVRDSSFLSGIIADTTRIRARGSTVVELPLTVSYEGLLQTISGLLDAYEVPFNVDLAVRFPIPILENRTFPASFQGSIPILKLPSLSFDGASFNSISLSGVEFSLNWRFDNRNIFPVNLDVFNYNFVVNNSPWVSGSAPQISLPARQVTEIPITARINSLPLIQEIISLSTGGRLANFVCTGEFSLSLQPFENLSAISVIQQPFSFGGTTNIR